MILDHYQQTKNLLVSYSPKAWASFSDLLTPPGGHRPCPAAFVNREDVMPAHVAASASAAA